MSAVHVLAIVVAIWIAVSVPLGILVGRFFKFAGHRVPPEVREIEDAGYEVSPQTLRRIEDEERSSS